MSWPPASPQRTRRIRPPAYACGRPARGDGGMATAVTAAATRNSPTMILAASLEAHVSSASTTSGSRSGRSRSSSGMNWSTPPARVHLVAQPVDRRRAIGREDREPDRHADHPGDGHDRRGDPEEARSGRFDRRGGSRRDREPEPETEGRQGERDPSIEVVAGSSGTSPAARRSRRREADEGHEAQAGQADQEPGGEGPTAVAPARAPRASRCSPARRRARDPRRPPPPMIAVAKA